VPELSLQDRQRHAFTGELNGVRVAELMLVPTSAQAPLSRPLGYADASESRAVWRGFRGAGSA
jgi:hypothetical protein